MLAKAWRQQGMRQHGVASQLQPWDPKGSWDSRRNRVRGLTAPLPTPAPLPPAAALVLTRQASTLSVRSCRFMMG